MATDLIFNVTPHETRAALIENGLVTELYIERDRQRAFVGNIYKGKVLRVLPGMQAAFVDIGLDRAAFLFVADICRDDWKDYGLFLSENRDESFDEDKDYPESVAPGAIEDLGLPPKLAPQDGPIEDLLKEGQEILVQVTKDPLGTKGPRVTMHASLPGRHLVFMPTVNHVGISRRIEDEEERERLKGIIEKIRPSRMGFIVRTVSKGRMESEFKSDMEYLVKLWEDIQKRFEQVTAPGLVHKDLNLTLRLIRDVFTPDIDRLLVDNKDVYDQVLGFVETFMPKLNNHVFHHDREEPVFDAYRVEVQISEALRRKVWLKSGGYIVIDEVEALTAIDVNTGKFVGHRNLDDTILKTNLEAVKEIAYQLRLRNIGGIIIIDFIDMAKQDHRDQVYDALSEALKSDRAQSYLLKFSELGLVEMTRKRTHESILRTLCTSCPFCEGKGYVKSSQTICHEIFRQVQRECAMLQGNKIVLDLHPDVAAVIFDHEHDELERLEMVCRKNIIIKTRNDFHIEQFEISAY